MKNLGWSAKSSEFFIYFQNFKIQSLYKYSENIGIKCDKWSNIIILRKWNDETIKAFLFINKLCLATNKETRILWLARTKDLLLN